MADWSEKCLTCKKAGSIPKWGWSWSCAEPECHYEAQPDLAEIAAVTTSAKTKT